MTRFAKAEGIFQTAWHEARKADAERRTHAYYNRPVFPKSWPEPVEEFWVTYSDGQERRHTECPPRPHLRVWDFGEFQATATFDRWSVTADADRFPTVWLAPSPPLREGGWSGPYKTTGTSHLWTRPSRKGGGND